MEIKDNKKKIDKDVKEIVLFRIKSSKLPPNINLFIGNSKEPLTKVDLINHVNKEDEIGKKIIAMQMNYLRVLKKGIRQI